MRRASASKAYKLKAYKYRIYPDDAQMLFFAKTFGCCRFVWNKMLEEKLQSYKKKERIPQLTPAQYKKEFPFLKEVDCFALVATQNHLGDGFHNHFKNRKQFKLLRLSSPHLVSTDKRC